MSPRELEPAVHVALQKGEAYADYLQLDKLLGAQVPRTKEHDEMLFIIQHQTSELWMKLMLHELDLALDCVKRDALTESFKVLSRVGHIQRMLFEQWAVLETMTPFEYLKFRDALGKSSGFQSFQYRAIEFMFGNKDAQTLLPHRQDIQNYNFLETRLKQPSLYDEFLRYLARHGHAMPSAAVERDFTQGYVKNVEVQRIFKTIYEAPDVHWVAYEMAEKLVDVEERFQLWRFRHLKTVHRIIGFRAGTGGSSGVPFLAKALETNFFPELWEVRIDLELKNAK
jgi:tryptophan 2,3-dioxygenase